MNINPKTLKEKDDEKAYLFNLHFDVDVNFCQRDIGYISGFGYNRRYYPKG